MRAASILGSGKDAGCASPRSSEPSGSAARGRLQRALRAIGCLAIFLEGLPAFFRLRLSGESNWRALWAQWISQRFLKMIDCSVRIAGEIPAQGLVVCNHLGYLDILVILSVHPATFVAKSEVRRWPFFGLLATLAGTIFVERDRRAAVSAPLNSMVRTLKAGLPVVLFPEGTSSDGATVLPFRSALLEAASVASVAVTPVAIDYDLEEGSVADEICYWREMVFGSHFWNLIGKQGLTATLRFGAPRPWTAGRKEHARALRLDIVQLRSSHSGPDLAP